MFYPEIKYPNARVRENAEHVSEKIIQAIWNFLFIRVDEMKTTTGIPIRILDQGTWNHDEGPDFRNAKIQIGDNVLSGDVEIHLKTSHWDQHHHSGNPHYKNVILHAVLENDRIAPHLPTVELRHILNGTLAQIAAKLNALTNPDYFCHDQIQEVPASKVHDWILMNGVMRLENKVDKYRTTVKNDNLDWNEILYRGLMDALGYSKNRKPFGQLAEKVPYAFLKQLAAEQKEETAIMSIQAILLGVGGLLEFSKNAEADLIPFMVRLEQIYGEFQKSNSIPPMDISDWKLFRMRPSNFPTLRIAGLSKVLARLGNQSFTEALDRITHLSDNTQWVHRWMDLFEVSSFGYWSHHYWWGDTGKRDPQDLIGKQRSSEIIVNVVFPVLILKTEIENETAINRKLRDLYQSVSSFEKNSVLTTMSKQLKLPAQKHSIQFAQGLLQLHRRCEEFNCADCSIFEMLVGEYR